MKVKVLYFATEKLVKMKEISVNEKSGTAKLFKDKEFSFDNTVPLHIEGGTFFKSVKPFYILKHDIHKPLDVKFTLNSKTAGTDAEMVVTPENFKNMMTQGTLNTLLTLTSNSTSQMILFIAIGAVIGFLLGNVIPIKGLIGGG